MMRTLPLLIAVLLAGCGRSAPPEVVPCVGLPCDLFADLGAWQLRGLAADAHAGLPEPAETTELLEDFEGEGPWAFGEEPGAAIGGAPGSRHLLLTTESKLRPRWRSPIRALRAGRRYTLSWREALDGITPPRRVPPLRAGVSVEFFSVPRSVEEPETWLAEPANAKKAKLTPPKAGQWRPAEGRSPWRAQQRAFRAPPRATHLQIVVGGGPLRKGGAGSRLEVDDISLTSAPAAAWTGLGADAWQEPGADPLQYRARAKHRVHRHANEVRDVVLSPAPSALIRSVRLPEEARLDLGYGFVPGGSGPAVSFAVTLVDEGGRRHSLVADKLRGSRTANWRDAAVDLGAWGGQTVTLELETSGRPPPSDPVEAAARQPEANAVWTTARLEHLSRKGKLAVLVMIDTLGARHASGWEGKRRTTPNLQRIGKEGVLYGEARSPAPWTLPSSASYLTGLSPDEHGAGEQLGRDHWSRRPLLNEFDTLPELLKRAGWDTRAWINNTFLTSQVTQLDQGFSRYVDYGSRTDRGGSKIGMNAVVKELGRTAGDRFLLVHLMDPHLPYRPPQEFLDRFVDPTYKGPLINGRNYRAVQDLWRMKLRPKKKGRKHLLDLHEAAIAFADQQVGRVYDAARATGQDLLFIVTSDHGEEFWEHGSFDHGHSLFDELLHVPLVVYETGKRADVVHQPVDVTGVFGTVLRFAGLDPGDRPSLPRKDTDAVLHASPTLYGVRQRSVEQDGWKYIVRQPHSGSRHRRVRNDPLHLLFNLDEDPGEAADRMLESPGRALAMHRLVVDEALPGFPGAWFVWVGPGEDPVDVTWTMTGGDGWHPDVTDLPWPTPDGVAPARGALGVKRDVTEEASTITLSVAHRPTLLLLEPARFEGDVTVRMGEGQDLPPPARFTGEDLLGFIDAGEPGPVLGRLAGEARSHGDVDAPNEGDLEALRALGYMD